MLYIARTANRPGEKTLGRALHALQSRIWLRIFVAIGLVLIALAPLLLFIEGPGHGKRSARATCRLSAVGQTRTFAPSPKPDIVPVETDARRTWWICKTLSR